MVVINSVVLMNCYQKYTYFFGAMLDEVLKFTLMIPKDTNTA